MVEVTEADRLALDHHRGRIFQFRRNNDDEHMLDTLSRHRTASTAAKEARIVELEAALRGYMGGCDNDECEVCENARKALGEG